MNIAVLPARSGSKRIKHKNIRALNGKPIIKFPIEAARLSGLFDQIIVSTDAKAIADISISCGAKVPFLRPSNLSDDHTNTIDVVHHAVTWAVKNGLEVSNVCCIYPTSAFIEPDDLVIGLNNLTGFDYCFAACKYPHPPERRFLLDQNGKIKIPNQESMQKRTQDLKDYFHDAGLFYWASTETWLQKKPIISKNSTIVEIPLHRAIDIDDEQDWQLAELLDSSRPAVEN